MMTTCARCKAELVPDNACPDTNYAFDNALWIGLYGGYGMFVDNLEAKLPINTDERWIRNSDERDEYGFYCDFKLGDVCTCYLANASTHWSMHELFCPCRNPIDDPTYVPKFREERILPGHPDYEAVLCHDCAHGLCEREPWLNDLIQPARSHAHKQAYQEAHPDHVGWDYDTSS